jgi:hypothetical protein
MRRLKTMPQTNLAFELRDAAVDTPRSGRIRTKKTGRVEWAQAGARCHEPVEIVALLSLGCAVHTMVPVTPGTHLRLHYNGLETPAVVSYCMRRNNLSFVELGLTFLEAAA